MRAKSIVLILIASGCGLVASIGISQVMDRNAAKGGAAGAATDKIFVAMTDIDIGEELSAENVKLEEWPKDKVPEGAIRTLEKLEGSYARTRLYPGEPILHAKLMDSNGDVDSLKIPEGYRAVSIKVTMDSSVSGLIQPGDRVDIIAFLRKNSDVPKTMARAILRDVRVFAVNSETERSVDSSGNAITAKTVSVLVKDTQVEPLMLAHELGQLRLSLRRPNDTTEEAGDGVADVDTLLGRAPEVADDRKPASDGDGASNFLSWLQNQQTRQETAPAPARFPAEAVASPSAPAFEMEVITPDGPVVYRWSDPNQLPEEVQSTSGLAPEPMAAAAAASEENLEETPEEESDGSAADDQPEEEPMTTD